MKKLMFLMLVLSTMAIISCNSSSAPEAEATAKESSGKCGQGKCGGDCGDDEKAESKDYFAQIDADADGKVTLDEFKAHAKADYVAKDMNKSGDVCSKECMMFDMFNTDGDDKLSEDEFVAGHEKMFSKVDSNADGSIDGEEWKAFAAMMHKSKDGESKCGEGKCGK